MAREMAQADSGHGLRSVGGPINDLMSRPRRRVLHYGRNTARERNDDELGICPIELTLQAK